ncbi:MAG: sugar ABC transporter permease [Oscillospiraceae bacterium]|jgi:multiple sugar transport system permease protein|nr:sugar ABC transporter permease [Oscillospiraceae bacterium]
MDNSEATAAKTAPVKRRRRARLEKSYWGYIFIAPFFIAYILFSAYPLFTTFYYAFTFRATDDAELGAKTYEAVFEDVLDADGNPVMIGKDPLRDIVESYEVDEGNWSEFRFVGLQNFYYKGDGYRYWKSEMENRMYREKIENNNSGIIVDGWTSVFTNTALIWIVGFIPQIGLALLLAAWFTDAKIRVKGQGLFKVIFYMPNIMTAATIGYLFFMFSMPNGPLHIIAQNIGAIAKTTASGEQAQLAGPIYSRGIVAFINFWMWFGNTMIVMIAGILGINPSLFEAANIDGANGNQVFWRVTVPLIRPILTFNLIQSLIGGLQMFDVPTVIGGFTSSPHGMYIKTVMTQIQSTAYEVSSLGAGKGFGYSAAAAVMLFIITTIISVFIFIFMRDRSETKYLKKQKKLMKLQARMGGAH